MTMTRDEDIDVDAVIAELPNHLDPAAPAVKAAFVVGDERVVLDGRTARRSDAPAPLTITTSREDFLALVSGGENAAILFLSGRLRAEGDVRAALELASSFRMPGSDGAVDVADVDPDAIARVVRDTDRATLKTALEGDAREIVLEQVFAHFPAQVRPEAIADVEGIISWKITARDAEPVRHRVQLTGGRCLSGADADARARPRVTIACDGVTLLEVVTANANPAIAFLTRRLRVNGDLGFAAQLPTLFRMPSA